MMLPFVTAGLAGGLAGYVLRGSGPNCQPQPVDLSELIGLLKARPVSTYELRTFSGDEARNNAKFEVAGDFLAVLSGPRGTPWTLRLNSPEGPALDTQQHRAVRGVFHTLYLSNPVRNDELVVLIGRGLAVDPPQLAAADLAELAARLGSSIPQDCRGRVIWQDGFEDGLAKWATAAGGTGAGVAVSTSSARNGAKSALLTAGSDGAHNASITHVMPINTDYPVGVAFAFNLGANAYDGAQSVKIELDFQINADVRFALRWVDDTQGAIEVDNGAGFVALDALTGSVEAEAVATLYHTVKVTVDPTERQAADGFYHWGSLRFNGQTFDISANTSYFEDLQSLNASPTLAVIITFTGRAGVNDTCNLDDVVVTTDEP